MKKGNLKKVLFILMVEIVMLLALSVEEHAETAMVDQLNVPNNNGIMPLTATSSEAGIYQTALNAYVETDKKIDSSIANTRTIYGAGEKIKIRFSFSKEISSYENAKLIIKFGEGSEKVISKAKKDGSYLEFEYSITEEDNGGLTLVGVEGKIIGTDGVIPVLGLLERQSTWTNTIVAKGKWETNGITSGCINFATTMGDTTVGSAAYVWDDNKKTIRPMKKSDVYKLDTTTGAESQYSEQTEEIDFAELSEDGKGVKKLIYTDNNSIIYIPNACDIAGNKRAISNAKQDSYHVIYVIGCTDQNGNPKEKNSNGKTYLKKGEKIKFLGVNCGNLTWVPSSNFLVGEKTDFGETTSYQTLAEDIYTVEYTIQDGENGVIKVNCNNAKFNATESGNFIADTTAPEISWKYLDMNATEGGYSRGWIAKGENYANTNLATIPGKYTEGMSPIKKTADGDAILYLKEGEIKWGFDVTEENLEKKEGKFTETLYEEDSFKNVYSSDYFDEANHLIYPNAIGTMHIKSGMYGIVGQVKVTDKAGNFTETNNTWAERLKIIVDRLEPKVTVTPEDVSDGVTNKDILTFNIKAEDQSQNIDSDKYDGSGVSEYVDQNKIVVENGTILEFKKDNQENGATIAKLQVLASGAGPVKVYVKEGAVTDNCDNPSLASNVASVTVDKDAPVINDITGVPTDWTDKATISVIASDVGVGGIKYAFFNGEEEFFNKNESKWQSTDVDNLGKVTIQDASASNNVFHSMVYNETNTIEIDKNMTLYVGAIDELGNFTKQKVEITKIDNDNPEIHGVDYHQGWTNQDVTVTINAEDKDSGIAAYSFDGEATWQTSPSKTYSSTQTISDNQIKVKDKTGKTAAYGSDIKIQIDKTAPTISTSISPEGDTEGEVTLTVTPNDEGGSSIASVNIDGEDVASSDGTTYSKTFSKNGDYTITVRDNAGNETSIVKTISNIIKKFEPTITFENCGNTYVRPTDGGKTRIRTAINVQGESGVSIQYALTKNTTAPTEWSDSIRANRIDLNLELNETGTYYLHAKVTKNDKEKTAISQAIKVVASKIELTADTNETAQSVTVTATYGEGLTENKKLGVGSVMSSDTSRITLTENGIVHAEATDMAGNRVYADLTVNNIVKIVEPQIEKGQDKYIKDVKENGGKKYLIVNPKTTADQLKTNVITDYEKTVENTAEADQLKTGSTLKIGTVNSEYTIVVKGDANCDGKLEFSDIVKINSIRLGKIEMANVPYEVQLASDVDGNSKIEFSDIVKINSYRLGKTNTL